MPSEKMRVIDLCRLRKAKLDAMLAAKELKAKKAKDSQP